MAYTFDGVNYKKVFPYVYKLTHKETGEFYFGSRYTKSQKLPAVKDIQIYQTSSKRVKNIGFGTFDVEIIAEFINEDSKYTDAYDFEQELIFESRHDVLLLNRWCAKNKKRFINFGEASKESREKMSLSRKGKPKTELHKKNIGKSNKNKMWAIEVATNEVRRVCAHLIDGEVYARFTPLISIEQRQTISKKAIGNKSTSGLVCYYDAVTEKEIKIPKDDIPPIGYIKGKPPSRLKNVGSKISAKLKGKVSPTKGKMWIHNISTKERTLIDPTGDISIGWSKGYGKWQ